MKKLLFPALALVMALTLAGCGSNSASDNSQQVQPSSAQNESSSVVSRNEQSSAQKESSSVVSKNKQSSTQNESRPVVSQNKSKGKNSSATGSSSETAANKEGADAVKDVRVKLTFNNEDIIVKMYDNPTSRDFLTLLPLTLTFEDYAGTEKIGYLPRNLSTQDAPSGSDPSVGDLTLYAPWGNLAIFYRDYGYSNELIKLGNIESGIEKLASITGDFTVKIEKID